MGLISKEFWTGRRLFIAIWILVALVYLPTFGAGFVKDFLGWQETYNNGSLTDLLNCFGYPGLHHVLHFFFYSFYSIFHLSPLPWFILFVTLHTSCGWLLLRFIRQLFETFTIDNGFEASIIGSLIFLLSPYQTEVVVWKACMHYLLSGGFLILILSLTLKYLALQQKRFLWQGLVVYLLSLFTLEVSYMTPLIVSVIAFVYYSRSDKNTISLFSKIKPLGYYFGCLILFLFLNKIALGSWVGHYGSEVHLRTPFDLIFANLFKYGAKHFAFVRYLPHDAKAFIFGLFDKPILLWSLVTIGSLIGIGCIIWIRRLSSRQALLGMSLLQFFISVLPVSNLFFVILLGVENDRYGYIPTIFLAIFYALFFTSFRKKWMRLLVGLFLCCSVVLLIKTNISWYHNTKVYSGLKESYKWKDYSQVFILNVPDNYEGTYMCRLNTDANTFFRKVIQLQTDKEIKGEVYDVANYNMMQSDAAVSVEQIDKRKLKVQFKQWGNWWWREGIGARNYSTKYYKVEFKGRFYEIEFKELADDAAVIFQQGKEWKEFRFK